MGLFKKQRDPFSERAAHLNNQIAALEAQIRELSDQPPTPLPPASARDSAVPTPPAAKPAPTPQPRLRSTIRPIGPVPAASPFQEPIFEHVDQERLHQPPDAAAPEPEPELGTRRNDVGAFWDRLKNHFRGPATTNPKLVSYLAAGSIQGLRPLRYEKRVARNRFIILFIFLVLALYGLSVMFLRR